ncbi:MAG: hypothetical protein FWD67_10255 [Betaproteobacteria bacterium]|nr:hypothetical protein [Betaproteobacteria bacterium]
MNRIGPVLETLLRRLADTPPDFLDEPRVGNQGEIFVPALVNDLFSRFGYRVSRDALQTFYSQKHPLGLPAHLVPNQETADRNRLTLVMVLVWLLADEWFEHAHLEQEAVLRLLSDTTNELAASATAKEYVHDPERREELARRALARLGFRPEGETEAQAADRLSAIDAAERRRLLLASQRAEARARAVREALIRKQAEESADKWTRE